METRALSFIAKVGSEVFADIIMRSVATPSNSDRIRRFEEKYRLHRQGPVFCFAYSPSLTMDTIRSSETSGSLETIWRYNPEYRTFHHPRIYTYISNSISFFDAKNEILQKYWVSWTLSIVRYLKNSREHDFSETWFVFVLKRAGQTLFWVPYKSCVL
jgi:hypothetical protein